MSPGSDKPVMWISDGPAPAGLWERLYNERERSGLWPLLLAPLEDTPAFRPWESQELYPQRMSSPGEHDAVALLRGWWEGLALEDQPEDVELLREVTAPFGTAWPGLAPSPALVPATDADGSACVYAARLLQSRPGLRIGLVAAGSGADALTICGWNGPVNHWSDTGKIAAVVRSWEQRFGCRVVGVGFDTLDLSVAVPPTGMDDALLVAAEHYAFCPANIDQGSDSMAAYAQGLLGEDAWTFWWD